MLGGPCHSSAVNGCLILGSPLDVLGSQPPCLSGVGDDDADGDTRGL